MKIDWVHYLTRLALDVGHGKVTHISLSIHPTPKGMINSGLVPFPDL